MQSPSRWDPAPTAGLDCGFRLQIQQLDCEIGSSNDTIRLTVDGTVTLTTRFGNTTNVVEPATVDDVQQKIEDAELPTLKPVYMSSDCADDFKHTVTANVGAKSYTVTADGCAEILERLNAVIDALNQLTVRRPAVTRSPLSQRGPTAGASMTRPPARSRQTT